MASYNSILRHVSLADVKRNTWKLQEQKRIDEQRRKKELEIIANNNSSLYSDWRFDLSENMTTQAMTYATTLPAEGDTTLADVTASEYIKGSGASVVGSRLVLDSNNIIGTFGNATAETGLIDLTKFTTLKLNVSRRTVGSREELRLFYRTEAMRSGGPNNWYLLINELYNNQTIDLTALREIHGTLEFQIRSFFVGAATPRDYTTWNINSFVFQRRTPITVFVALDSPEAAAFVRTGEFGELTSDEKKKKLQDMLNAGDAYLLNKFGDPFPGTGGDYSFTDVQLPPSWEQAQHMPTDARDYTDQDDPINDGPFPDDPFDDSDFEDPFPDIELASTKGAGEEPGLMRKGLKKKTGGKMAPMPIYKPKPPKGGYKMPIVPSDYNPNDELYLASADWPKGDPSKAPLPIYKPGGGGVPYVPGVPQPFRGSDGKKYPMAKKNGKKKQPVVAHYEPEGEVIMEKKLKKPQAFFKDKDIKPEFPENPPPPQIKGLHPDLVTGDSVSQRFNRLDPISARAMPRTGIKSVDKKVQIAKKKPK